VSADVLNEVQNIWDAVVAVHHDPSTYVLLGTGIAALILIIAPGVWPLTRHFITVIHEGGHAFIALLAGRKLTGIKLHSDTSGLTLSRGKPRGLGMIFSLLAGYTAPTILGLGATWMLVSGRPAAVLWLLLVIFTLILLQVRNFYGLWVMLVLGFGIFALTWWASAELQQIAAYLITWFLVISAPRPVLEMQKQRRRGASMSDADQLGRLTHTPGGLWTFVFFAITLAGLVGAGMLLLKPVSW